MALCQQTKILKLNAPRDRGGCKCCGMRCGGRARNASGIPGMVPPHERNRRSNLPTASPRSPHRRSPVERCCTTCLCCCGLFASPLCCRRRRPASRRRPAWGSSLAGSSTSTTAREAAQQAKDSTAPVPSFDSKTRGMPMHPQALARRSHKQSMREAVAQYVSRRLVAHHCVCVCMCPPPHELTCLALRCQHADWRHNRPRPVAFAPWTVAAAPCRVATVGNAAAHGCWCAGAAVLKQHWAGTAVAGAVVSLATSSVHSHSSRRLHPRVCLARCARATANAFAGGGSRRAQAAQACKSCGGVTHGDEG